jgi:putative ABC transport system permease protein
MSTGAALSRPMVRHNLKLYAGAFVALCFGVLLIGCAVTLAGAVDATAGRDGVTAAERGQLEGLAAMFGTMSAIAVFLAMFVVASTFAFVVAARRRELGLLRLVGATPRQIRRTVLGESLVVAALATVAGCLLTTVAAPALLAGIRALGVTDLRLDLPAPWLAWAVSLPCGAGVALVGSWRASKRASRVPPLAALQEATLERRRPSLWQVVVGTTCLVAVGASVVVAPEMDPLFALVTSILLPEVAVVGLVCFGAVLFPALAGRLAAPFVRQDVTARLARDQLRTSARTPAAIAAPILAISAIAGSLILAIGFTADWTAAINRELLKAPLVVETAGDPGVATRLTAAVQPAGGLAVVDPRLSVEVGLGAESDREPVEVVDVDAARRARGLRAVRGDLGRLGRDGVAVTETYATDTGVGIGDRLRIRRAGGVVRPRVVAVVPEAPDLYAQVLVSRALLGGAARTAVPDVVFVVPREGTDVAALLAGTPGRVRPAGEWLDEVDRDTRAANEVGLWVLLGPAALYAGIAIVNAVLMGSTQRRRQLRTVALLGATQGQRRRTAMWEAGLVGVAALLTGAAVTAYVGWLVRSAIVRQVPGAALHVPWLPLAAVLAVCLGLALVAAAVGARRERT